LSNDELLEILAKSNDIEIIQQNLRTCFDNIMRLEIKDGVDIVKMISAEGEVVTLSKSVKLKNPVEAWLLAVKNMMVETIRKLMKAGWNDYTQDIMKFERKTWVTKHPGQVVSTISQVIWC
jgi:dynein heavy chain